MYLFWTRKCVSCKFNSRFISFTVITSIATHCMPAPNTVCYNCQLDRWVHHQPSCTEWTACIYHIMCPADARHIALPDHACALPALHKQVRHCSHGHWLACCCNWRCYTASVEHSMLNQWLGSLCRASYCSEYRHYNLTLVKHGRRK